MTGRIVRIALMTGALLSPAAAHAVTPNHTGELKAFGDKFAWSDTRNSNSGGIDAQVIGEQPFTMCQDPGFPCDHTLLHITTAEATQLDITVTATGLYRPDVDLYLYASDKDGAVGDEIANSETPSATESISTVVDPGYYLLRGAYWSGFQDNSTGSATISVPPPPDPEDCGDDC